uniref:Uncharacterized protein LOC105133892 n=1 Tax=Rhizophora mucronata TaxID=61149 RepID=A0A2P2R166_RHIMU
MQSKRSSFSWQSWLGKYSTTLIIDGSRSWPEAYDFIFNSSQLIPEICNTAFTYSNINSLSSAWIFGDNLSSVAEGSCSSN